MVVAFVGPKQFSERHDLGKRLCIDALWVRDNRVQNALLPRPESRQLFVDDGVDRDGSLAEPIGKFLLMGGERAEAFGFKLDEAGGAHAVHQSVVAYGGALLGGCA